MYVEKDDYYSSNTYILVTSKGGGYITSVDFYYNMYGSTMGTLRLDTSVDGSTWTTHFTKTGNQGTSWHLASIIITDGSASYVRFRGTTGSGGS